MTYPATPDRHTIRDTAWQDRALCVGADPEDFYPNPIRNDRAHVEDVKAICRACPVAADCLEDAIATADYWGIRGGYTGDEIRAIARRRGRAPRPSRAGETPIDHGTPRGYRQHRIRSEEPCTPCQRARDTDRETTLRALLATQHGSKPGYDNHRRLSEPACEACKRAAADMSADQRRQRRKDSA